MSKAISTSHFAADAAEMHLHAYNAAFYELGLRWYWDASTYQHPLPDVPERGRIRNYLENQQQEVQQAEVGVCASRSAVRAAASARLYLRAIVNPIEEIEP